MRTIFGEGCQALAFTLLTGIAVMSCGGAGTRPSGAKPKQAVVAAPPVKPAALKEFEAGLRAMRLGGEGAIARAKQRFESAIALDPALWEAWHNLGVLAENGGDDQAAVASFSKAIAAYPGNTGSLLARSEVHRRLSNVSEAKSDLMAVLAQASDDSPLRQDAATRLASLLRDAGKHEEAVNALRDVIRTNGATARIYTELGMIYLAQKRVELAALVLAKAIEIDAKEPSTFNALALLSLQQGKAQEAFDRFDRATELDPKYTDARFNKATVLLDAGDYARAKTELAKIVADRSDDLGAWIALGVCERGLRNFPAAKAAWERVVNRGSDNREAIANALFNLAILKLDFTDEQADGKALLDRYLKEAPAGHSKRQAAQEKRKELK